MEEGRGTDLGQNYNTKTQVCTNTDNRPGVRSTVVPDVRSERNEGTTGINESWCQSTHILVSDRNNVTSYGRKYKIPNRRDYI